MRAFFTVALLTVAVAHGLRSGPVLGADLAAEHQKDIVGASNTKCNGVMNGVTTTYSGKSSSCSGNWDDVHCWSKGAVPTSDDVALISGNKELQIAARRSNKTTVGDAYNLRTAKSIIITDGALVSMEAAALEVMECLYVTGDSKLDLTGTMYAEDQGDNGGLNSNPGFPATDFAEDPNQPMGTDCRKVPAGFAPRICGPGVLQISNGSAVNVTGFYASLFLGVSVSDNANLTAENNAFIWGVVNLTSSSSNFRTKGYIYMHGFLYVFAGSAQLEAVAFDKWATKFVESPPLLIENRGMIEFYHSLHTTEAWYYDKKTGTSSHGTYKAAILNYGEIYFNYHKDLYDLNAGIDFDLFNYATVHWKGRESYYASYNWIGNGNFVNRGTFLTDNAQVYLSTYHSVGGTLEHRGSGTFNFGNGAVNPRTVRLCTMQNSVHTVRDAQSRQRKHAELREVEQRDGCWWYGTFCYHTPYIFTPPQLKMNPAELERNQEKAKRPAGQNSITVELSKVISKSAVPSPCSQRYSFSGKSVIKGDGTGSLVSTVPVAVEGRLDVSTGGKWYAMTEHGNPPVWHGGSIHVKKLGEMSLGISADFNHDGKLVVERGGHLLLPRHAKVTVSNHTIAIKKGGIFQIDGLIATNELSNPIQNCGEIRGKGKIIKSKDSDFQC